PLHRRHGRARQELLQRPRVPLRLRGSREEDPGPLPRGPQGRGDGGRSRRAGRRGVARRFEGAHPRPPRGVARVAGRHPQLRYAQGRDPALSGRDPTLTYRDLALADGGAKPLRCGIVGTWVVAGLLGPSYPGWSPRSLVGSPHPLLQVCYTRMAYRISTGAP